MPREMLALTPQNGKGVLYGAARIQCCAVAEEPNRPKRAIINDRM